MSEEPHQQEYVGITKAMAAKNGYELDTNQEDHHGLFKKVEMASFILQNYMYKFVQASLNTKETKQVDENVNKNLLDQNDINFEEEGLAICIVAEEGYVNKSEIFGAKITPDMLEDENEKEEFVVDG